MTDCNCGACGVVYPGSPGYAWCASMNDEESDDEESP